MADGNTTMRKRASGEAEAKENEKEKQLEGLGRE